MAVSPFFILESKSEMTRYQQDLCKFLMRHNLMISAQRIQSLVAHTGHLDGMVCHLYTMKPPQLDISSSSAQLSNLWICPDMHETKTF